METESNPPLCSADQGIHDVLVAIMECRAKVKARYVHPRVYARSLARRGDCLLWTGACTSHRYASISIKGRETRLQRIVLAFKLARPIREGYEACHTCVNHHCVEPSHLYEGTRRDNMEDRSRGGYSRLTAQQVSEVRTSRETGVALAAKLGVSASLISLIRLGKAYQWVQ